MNPDFLKAVMFGQGRGKRKEERVLQRRMLEMDIAVRLDLVGDRENLVVVVQGTGDDGADRLQFERRGGRGRGARPGLCAVSATTPRPPRPPPCTGTSNLYGTTAHGCPVFELVPTSEPTYMSRSFVNSAHFVIRMYLPRC